MFLFFYFYFYLFIFTYLFVYFHLFIFEIFKMFISFIYFCSCYIKHFHIYFKSQINHMLSISIKKSIYDKVFWWFSIFLIFFTIFNFFLHKPYREKKVFFLFHPFIFLSFTTLLLFKFPVLEHIRNFFVCLEEYILLCHCICYVWVTSATETTERIQRQYGISNYLFRFFCSEYFLRISS